MKPRLGQMDTPQRAPSPPGHDALGESRPSQKGPPPPRPTNPPSHLASVPLLPTAATSVDVPSTLTATWPRQRSPGSFPFRPVLYPPPLPPSVSHFFDKVEGPAHLHPVDPCWGHTGLGGHGDQISGRTDSSCLGAAVAMSSGPPSKQRKRKHRRQRVGDAAVNTAHHCAA